MVFPLWTNSAKGRSEVVFKSTRGNLLVEAAPSYLQALVDSYRVKKAAGEAQAFNTFERGGLFQDGDEYPVFNASVGTTYEFGHNEPFSNERIDALFVQGTSKNTFRFLPTTDSSIILFLPDRPIQNRAEYIDFTQLAFVHPYALKKIEDHFSDLDKNYEVGDTVYFAGSNYARSVWRFLKGEREILFVFIGDTQEVEMLDRGIEANINDSIRHIKNIYYEDDVRDKEGNSFYRLLHAMFLDVPTYVRDILTEFSGRDYAGYYIENLNAILNNLASELFPGVSDKMRDYLDRAFLLTHAGLDDKDYTSRQWLQIAQRIKSKKPDKTIDELVSLTIDTVKGLANRRDHYADLLWRNAIALVDSAAAPQAYFSGDEENYNLSRIGFAGLFIELAARFEGRSPEVAAFAFWETLKKYNHDIISVETNYETNEIKVNSRRHDEFRESLDPVFTKPLKDVFDVLQILEDLSDDEERKFQQAELSAVDARRLLVRMMSEEGDGVPRFLVESGPSFMWRMFKQRFGSLFEGVALSGGPALTEIADPKTYKHEDRMIDAGKARLGFSLKTNALAKRFYGERDKNEWIQISSEIGTVLVWPESVHGYFSNRYGKKVFGKEVKIIKRSGDAGRGMLFLAGVGKTLKAADKWKDNPADIEDFLHMIGSGVTAHGQRVPGFPGLVTRTKGAAISYAGDFIGLLTRRNPEDALEDIPDAIPGPKMYDVDLDSWRRKQGVHYLNEKDFLEYMNALREGL